MSGSDFVVNGPDDEGPLEQGGQQPPQGPRAPRPGLQLRRPRRSPLTITLLILGVLAFLATIGAELLTDSWWFDSVGFGKVFITELGTKALIFGVAALLTAGIVGASMFVAYRTRPFEIPMTPGQQVLEQYRQAIEPVRKAAAFGIPVILGLLAGAGSIGAWKTYLLWRGGGSFGVQDRFFGEDVGFFVFTLPWLSFLVSFFSVVLGLALLGGLFTQYVYGGFQLPGRGRTTPAAFIQLAVLGALLAVLRGASYWLDRYFLTTERGALASITGITYSRENAQVPAQTILAIAALVCAALFLAAIWTRSWRLPLTGVALLVVTSLVVGSIYPRLLQSFKVKPSELSLESPYIDANIAATRTAYGLDRIKAVANPTDVVTEPAALREAASEIPGIRIIDPTLVSPSFRQFQSPRQYYAFPDTLDVDRYTIDGKVRDVVVAVRELSLDGVPESQRNWINDHTVYTHGYGFVGAYANERTGEGDPRFFETGLGTGSLGDYEPRIYFGELSPTYSVVGAPSGAQPREFDVPEAGDNTPQRTNTYQGTGGVPVGSALAKFAYAVKYRELNFFLSDTLTSQSRILDHRAPIERVERVAPWLTLDGNVYPAVVEGRVQWIVDGFTTSATYPGSRHTDLGDATSDSVTERSRVVSTGSGLVNYMRNSVKATVDAFDGTVKLYAWDEQDPILKAWQSVFPGTVQPRSTMSGDLMSHIRYPQDLLKVQRQLLTEYHVTDAAAFYYGSDRWRVPKDPNHNSQDQPVYFQSLAMPDQQTPAFSLTTTFVPLANSEGSREIMRGLLVVDADAGSKAGQPSDQFGTLRLLSFPGRFSGPAQVLNQIQTSPERSQNPAETQNLSTYITQNSQSGKILSFGNLLTFPLAGNLLYIQPVFVQQSKAAGSFPQNKITVAVYNDKVAWGDTVEQALNGLFGKGASTPTQPGGTPPPATQTDAERLASALADAQKAYDESQVALRKGDFTAYGEAQKRLAAALERARAAAPGALPGTSPQPSSSPSGSPSPTASPSPTG